MRLPSYCLPRSRGTAAALPSWRLQTLLAALLTFSGLTLLPQAAHAQKATLRLSRLSTEALPDLKLYLNYLDAEGSVVSSRTAADFKLMIDAVEQGPASALSLFEKSGEPTYVVAIAQVSGALGEPLLAEVRAGFRRLSQTVATSAASRTGVLAYAGSTKRLLDSGSAPQVEGALAKLGVEAAGAELHLLDALRTAIDLLKAQPEGRRKLIVVVSDGTDVSTDKRSFINLGNRAKELGIVIDTIGYNELDPSKLQGLQEISRRCSGASRVAKSATEVSAQLSAVAEEIQKQYVATFRLSVTGDDQEHAIQVFEESSGKSVFSNLALVKLPAFGTKLAPGGRNQPPVPVKRPLIVPPT